MAAVPFEVPDGEDRAARLGSVLEVLYLIVNARPRARAAACHAVSFRVEDTDWPRVVSLYGELVEVSPSPVVELNRAVAVSMASGAEAGLDLVDQLRASGTLEGYHLLPGVRGDLLEQLGRLIEAAGEFRRAASLTRNEPERKLLQERAGALEAGPAGTDARGPVADDRLP